MFDTFTKEERELNDLYKNATGKNKSIAKKIRDEKIASYEGIRKIDKNRLYSYDYDEENNIIEGTEQENSDKQIALFESEMARYATDFKEEFPLVMEIVYLKISNQSAIYKQILNNGLLIADKKYIFYSSTTNQMKRGEIILLQEDFAKKHEKKFMCGLTDDMINSRGGCNRGKYLAYKGLPMSASFIPDGYEIDIDKCLVVPDFETIVNENVECIDIDHAKKQIIGIERRNEDVPIPQTDGAGMFLPGVLPTSAQIRCGHLKGAIFPFDFRKFLMQDEVEGIKPSPIINDAWGNEHDVIEEDIQVLFTASQLKMHGYYDSWEEFKKYFNENNMKIAVNKFADTNPKGYAKTSYQFIQTLSSEKLTDDKIKELCKDTIEYLDKMKTDLQTMVKIMTGNDDYLSLTLSICNDLVYDEYVQNKIEDKFKSERIDARGNKLILKDSLYSYICPDLYAFSTWLFCGIKNPKGIVPKNFVYNSFYNDKDYEKVDCLRSPHLYVEHGIRNLVKGEVLDKCKEWFNDLDTIVSSHDLLCRLLMFDVDGDEILLTPNQAIIDCIPDDIVPLYYIPFEATKSEINNDAIYDAVISSIENTQIGDISNVMTKNYNNSDIDMEFNKIMCCYNNLSIDYPKTQNNIKLGKYEEKYNKLKNEKCPYFFRYAKGKNVDSCKEKSTSNADRVCEYIHKNTGNKKYAWKDKKKKFNPSILINNENPIIIVEEKYRKLEDVMFLLKCKEQSLKISIDEAMKEMSKSDGWKEKCAKYDVFYHMCEKMIMNIFDTREEAAEYLIDMEYLRRENENRSKNILWNCFGDLIFENVKNNLCFANVKQRRKHYYTCQTVINDVEKKAIKILNEQLKNPVEVYNEELEWLEKLSYKNGCKLDRELLYILLVLSKKKDGNLKIYMRQKNKITCNTINKWLGDGVCICKKGMERLQKMGVISLAVKGRDYCEVKVILPEFKKEEVAFVVEQGNPLIPFYKNNGERKVSQCIICGKEFIKIGNTMTCGTNCSRENRKRNTQKKTA